MVRVSQQHIQQERTLIAFHYILYLKTPEGRNRLKFPITVTETSHTWSINREGCEYLLDCNHEEADTRIVLHASIAEENVVVVAKDKDVLVLLVNEFSKLLPIQEWVNEI